MLDIIKQIDVKYLTQLKRLSKQTKTNKTNKQTNANKNKQNLLVCLLPI